MIETSTAPTSTRERVLTAARTLFYEHGVTTVGVDRISEQARVSKRSLYQHFGTKDSLVAAALADPAGDSVLPTDDDGITEPLARIRFVFDRLRRYSQTVGAGFFGCPYVNTATELHDAAHPASVVALEKKRALTMFFATEAEAAGLDRPDELAEQLTVIFDGANAWSVVHDEPVRDSTFVMLDLVLSAHSRSLPS